MFTVLVEDTGAAVPYPNVVVAFQARQLTLQCVPGLLAVPPVLDPVSQCSTDRGALLGAGPVSYCLLPPLPLPYGQGSPWSLFSAKTYSALLDNAYGE